jgi:hypothetical protein
MGAGAKHSGLYKPLPLEVATMKNSQVEAKLRRNCAGSTSLLIRAGDKVIQTEFSELTPCEFSLWTSSPILVEIPPNGTKDFVAGLFSDRHIKKTTNGDYPHTIKFPIYAHQDISNIQTYAELPSRTDTDNDPSNTFAKVPLITIGTAVSGKVDGEVLVETHCVLPVWNDGSTVLVTLNWFEGESAEGTPNPEWHMRASTGLPFEMSMENLVQSSQLPTNAKNCLYHLHFSPWLLGSQILGNNGVDSKHKIWQREWRFSEYDEFSSVLSRLRAGLMENDPSELPNVA